MKLFTTLKKTVAIAAFGIAISTTSFAQYTLVGPAVENVDEEGNILFEGTPTSYVMADMSGAKSKSKKITSPSGAIGTTFDQEFFLSQQPTAVFDVTYTGFTAQEQAAFQYAVDIWSRFVVSDVPITINANSAPLNPGVLGQAGIGNYWILTDQATNISTVYGGALADKLIGLDLSGNIGDGSADMNITFSNEFPWYYGTDGNTPSHLFDYVTVTLHEIGHGLNISGGVGEVQPGLNAYFFTVPTIFDRFVTDENGDLLIDQHFPVASVGEAAALNIDVTSDMLFWNGPEAVSANGAQPVKLYAPSPFRPGSSYSHLNEDTFNGTSHSLMTPQIAPGEAQHNPGLVTRGMMVDMGWMSFPIPTMGQWALMILALLISSIGVVFVYKSTRRVA